MRARWIGSILLAGALVAGCSSEAEEPEALPSVTSAPSASPTPAAAAVPPAAQEATPQGAGAFARFFYAEVERAWAEADPEIIRRLSAPGCESCQLFIDSITNLREDGGRITPVTYEIKAAEAPALTGDEARVTVIYDSPAIQRFDGAGNLLREEPAVTNFEEELRLVRGDGGWLVRSNGSP